MKNLPPVDKVIPETTLGPVGRFFMLMDPSLVPAEVIDHAVAPSERVAPGPTLARGKYLANICTICHGPDQSGGANASSGLNLTPSGNLANWSEEDVNVYTSCAFKLGQYSDLSALTPVSRRSLSHNKAL